jgi:cyclic pyranopterin phosphate synthase
MTTNASSLDTRAGALKNAGLQRVNVNLLSLKPSVYRHYTGGDLKKTQKGIGCALSVGLDPVKVNMLILKGVNDQEIPSMMEYCRSTGAILQILELERINISDDYYRAYHFDLSSIERMLDEDALKIEIRERMQGRKIFHLPYIRVEVVHPMENTTFCAFCSRIRLTNDGKLKPCLMRNDNLVDILTPLRRGATEDELRQLFIHAAASRIPFFQSK